MQLRSGQRGIQKIVLGGGRDCAPSGALGAVLRTEGNPEDRARRGEGLCPQWGSGGCAQTVADTEDRARLCPQFGLWVLHYSETLTLTLAFAMIDFGYSGPRL